MRRATGSSAASSGRASRPRPSSGCVASRRRWRRRWWRARRGRIEVMGDLARPLAFAVACELLGMPPRDRTKVRAWTRAITHFFLAGGAERAQAAAEAHARFAGYVLALVARRRKRPKVDL